MSILVEPSQAEASKAQIAAFSRFCEEATGQRFATPAAFHAFSVREFRTFWKLFLAFSGLATVGDSSRVCEGDEVETARFFPDLALNYAANLLRTTTEEDAALPAVRALDDRGGRRLLTRGELTAAVLSTADALKARGIGGGDRVVAIASNTADTLIACLACAAIGATWSSVSPDLGAPAILSRFEPLAPSVLFFHSAYVEAGELRGVEERVEAVVRALPTLRFAVSLRHDEPVKAGSLGAGCEVVSLDSLTEAPPRELTSLDKLPTFPWDHPLFILFSSGTTGRPKCLVHGAGGTLIEHHKEHVLHVDLRAGERLYFHTTCSWMMWNWLISALACRAEIVLYEGSITHPSPDALWQLVSHEKFDVFGTSPAFLQYTRDAKIVPKERFDFTKLRSVLSTGSVLRDPLFEWIRDSVKPVPVQSISGGTDIIGCFLLGHPQLAVHTGELQSKSLGLDVRALDPETGREAARGELVCAAPFPSRPVGIYADESGERFHQTYFSQNPGYWTHGDVVEWTENGGARVHGRSDGILNVRGVRIGPAEIYAALDQIDEIAESMAIEQRAPLEPGGSRLVLLLVLRKGVVLDKTLAMKIRHTLSSSCSPNHVPSAIAQVDELPQTHNGKRAEKAARDALNGTPLTNIEALKNPGCLAAIRQHPALQLVAETPALYAPIARDASTAPARTLEELEALLTPIWERILATPKIARTDNFHDLGGHSLLGINLLVQVEQATGKRLPMGTFLGLGSTIAGMAQAILAQPEQAATGASIVTIQPNGDRLPVYWLPGGGGVSTMAFREVSLMLGDDQPVYGFEAALKRSDHPVDLTETASEYVRMLQAWKPGPYVLFGFSYGSFMAYEVACQLREAGEEIALLAVFDTPAPRTFQPHEKALVALQRIRFHAQKLRENPKRQLSFFASKVGEAVRQRTRKNAPPPSPVNEATALFNEVNAQNLEAIRRYAKKPLRHFDGRVTTILARETSQSTVSPELDERLAWRDSARSIDVHYVNGTHLSMLAGADAVVLARELRTCLDGIQPHPALQDGDGKCEPLSVAVCDIEHRDRLHYAVRVAEFREQNDQLAAGPRNGDRLVLFGDSLVERFDVARFFPERDVLNRGINSDHLDSVSSQGLLRRYGPELLAPDPTHIRLVIGTNDIAAHHNIDVHIRKYAALLGRLSATYPDAKIGCEAVFPVRGNFAHLTPMILEFNSKLRLLADCRGVQFYDQGPAFADEKGELREEFTRDGLHLRWRAYEIWRDAICDSLGWKRPRNSLRPAFIAIDEATAIGTRVHAKTQRK